MPARPSLRPSPVALMCLAAAAALALAPRAARAQEGPIVTDRPSVNTTSVVLPAHVFQLELGVDADRSDGATVLSAPTKLRFGMIDSGALDLELQVESALISLDATQDARSLASPGLGAKINFYTSAEGGVSIGTLTTYYLGIEDGAGDVFSAALLTDFALGGGFSIAPNVGVAFAIGGGGARDYTAVVNLSRGLTDAVGAWVEAAAFWSDPGGSAPLGDPSTLADAGVTYLIDDDTQLDAWARVGLNGFGDSFGGGAGYSRRF